MATHQHDDYEDDEQDDVMLDPNEAGEEIPDDGDAHMSSDDEQAHEGEAQEEIHLQNDSISHFDIHKDSIFCITQHPKHPEIVATGGGDDLGYIWDASMQSQSTGPERSSIEPLIKLGGHSDSINAITFTLPDGAYVLTAGLDGRLRAYASQTPDARTWSYLAETQEVQEINFLIPCPHPSHPNTVALGASDGSVWVYTVNAADLASPLSIVQAIYLHTASCTAGCWTPDGKLLATVSEDGGLYVHDVFGEAAAAGISSTRGSAVISLTASDERFRVEGGLYSVAVSPGGTLVAVGGGEGHIRIVSLPRLSGRDAKVSGAKGGAGAKSKPGAGQTNSQGQAGMLLASLNTQSESVETIAFAPPPLTYMASGSVDGSIVLFDPVKNFAVRRRIEDAHEGEAVIKLEFLKGDEGWKLTSCGNDGVLRRWDARGSTGTSPHGLIGEWRGHRGGGEGGGILDFAQSLDGGNKIITAGDDGVALVFDMKARQHE